MTEFARDDGSRNKLARAIKRLRGLGGDRPRGITLDRYVSEPPSAQNAIDCLPGWNTALRPEIGVVAGPATFYDDPRIHWALDQFGDVTGKSVLELGPLEASHTALIERRGAGSILAIEANRLAYLRCLVVKELLGLKASKFELGDFAPWLETTDRRFDLVVA
ncbi:MAG: methyltransferase type 12, partial [Hyphomicrobiales bacterium]|nr:methyltransferase type 12 [Hyphomicrobiales bacterium]